MSNEKLQESSKKLVTKVERLSKSLNRSERENLKLLLSMAAGGILVGHADTISPLQRTALEVAQRSLPLLQSDRKKGFETGIVYLGKAPFFDEEDINALNIESLKYRKQAERFHDHYVASGAPLARELALSQKLHSFLVENVGEVYPTYKANYLYYDEPGLGIDPHVDKHDFSLNVLTMLSHTSSPRNSKLILYPPGQDQQVIQLNPGETLVFFADSVTHQRTRTVEGEKIRLVSFGYKTL
jgi:hypothetical protein